MSVIEELVERALHLTPLDGRALLGITGPPGSGKSTLATTLRAELNRERAPDRPVCQVVPMDGFHLSDHVLRSLGRLQRKGAIDTFDGHGYLALLRRLALECDHAVFAPSFHRDLEQPIAAGLSVEPSVRLVVTEGNYLLMDVDPWSEVRGVLSEVWYCHQDRETRRERLIARHIEFGKAPAEARAWVEAVDDVNAAAIEANRARAGLVVDLSIT